MFVARMITRAKWDPKPELQTGEISADAVTGDLRTRYNSLSFWRCAGATKGDVEDVALAIAAGRDAVAKIEIVWVKEEDLQADGQTLVTTDGHTPVADFVRCHVDVRRLDYERLGKVGRRIVASIAANQHSLLTRKRVRDLLESAVSAGRISLDELSEKIRADLLTSLGRAC